MICCSNSLHYYIQRALLAAVLIAFFGVARAGDYADEVAAIADEANFERVVEAGAAAVPDLLAGAEKSARKELIAQALGKIAAPQASPTLKKLASDPTAEVRANAAWALGQLKDESATAVLVELTSDSDPFVRQAALSALAATPGPDALQACISSLSDADRDVRRVAIRAVGKSGDKSSFQHLLPILDYRMVEAIPEDGEKTDTPELVPQWNEPDPTLRYHTIKALHELQCIDAVPTLIRAMEREISYNRLACMQAISSIGEPVTGVCLGRIVPISYESEKNIEKNWAVAVNNGTLAVIAGQLGDERCVPYLRNTLKMPMRNLGQDKDLTELVIETVRLLGRFKVEREARHLVRMLKNCRLAQLEEALTQVLVQIGPVAARHLARNLDDWQTSPFFMQLLRKKEFWTDEARNQLATYLTHESDDVRREATETFGLYLANGVIEKYDYPLLKAQLLDPDPIVRETTKKWLKKIGEIE